MNCATEVIVYSNHKNQKALKKSVKTYKVIGRALLLVFCLATSVEASEVGVERLMSWALENNADLKASEARFRSVESLVTPSYTPEDPMIGLSRLERGAETSYFTITQKFRFPVKYYLQGKYSKEKSLAKRAAHGLTVLSVRQQVVESYFNLYRLQKSIAYTLSNLESVKEVARVAEKKYSAKQGARADSMRSHVEITQLEIDLINYKQEERSAIDKIIELVNEQALSKDKLSQLKAVKPRIDPSKLSQLKKAVNDSKFDDSAEIRMKIHELKSAEFKSSLAKWEFAPDIQLQYQQAISGHPEDSRIYGVGITIPLFFWSKSSKSNAAKKEKISKRYELISTKRKIKSKLLDLLGKVETLEKTLKIYDTSLLPQVKGTYNTSMSSYRANNLGLMDLLDSERSLYQVRLGYLKTLQMFAKHLSELEKVSGIIISDL